MMARVPLLPLLVGLIVGIAGQRFIGSLWIPAIFLVSGAFCYRKPNLAIPALSVALGWLAAEASGPLRFERLPGSGTHFRAIVESVAQRDASRTLTLDVEAVVSDGRAVPTSRFRAIATVSYNVPEFLPGDIIEFSGTWSEARAQTDLPLENDMTSLYYSRGVSLLVFVPDNSITLVSRSRNPVYRLRRFRNEIVGELYGSGLSPEAASFMAAVVAGDADGISPQRREEFARAGVAHVLALSGAHVAIVAILLGVLLAPFAFAGHRRLRWWLAMALLWLFAIATGASASVVRSVIMASAVMLALIFDRPRSSLNSLCLAAILILVFSPRALFTIGFQLSFVATLGIVLFSDRLNPAGGRGKASGPIRSAAIVTTGATLATLPLVAWTFHQVPVYFLIANIVAAFIMPVMITGGLLLLLLMKVGIAAGWVVGGLNALTSFFDGIAASIASLPGATVGNIYFPFWLLIPLYAALALFCLYVNRRRKPYAIAAAALAVVPVAAAMLTGERYNDAELFVVRDKAEMRLIVRRGAELNVITSSPAVNREADSIEISRRYRDYLATRGVGRISFTHVDATSQSDFHFDFGGKRFKMAGANVEATDSAPATYCIVNHYFRGDIVALAGRCNADTVLLTSDINSRRRKRYLNELEEAGINAMDTSGSTFISVE